MNILKHELRVGLKTFLLWALGLFFLVFVGMVKYTGINGSASINVNELFDKFPRIVLAVLGMVGVDVTSLGGYYAVITYYTFICVAVYALSLGLNAVNREAIDKTYEFIFTKPRKRNFILLVKYGASYIYLLLFCILNWLFSVAAVASLNIENTIENAMMLYSIVLFLLGMLFMAIGAFVGVMVKKTEKGSLYANLCFLVAFILSMIYDMMEHGGIVKVVSPLKYFAPKDVLSGKLDIVYVLLCIVVTLVLGIKTFFVFEKRDLTS